MPTPSKTELLQIVNELRAAGLEVKVSEGSTELTQLAHHEAGHAVVARALGGSVESISITAERRSARIGRLDHEEFGLREEERLKRVEVVAKTLLGGMIAEQRCSGASEGWGGDVPTLAELLMSNPHPRMNGTAWLVDLVNATNALVSQCWEDIKAIADELVEKNTLAKGEISEVLRRRRMGDRG